MIFESIILLIEGLVIGFVASILPGPIGVLCIQRTINNSRKSGFISGLGAASADTIFALIAVFALSYVTAFLADKMYWVQTIGGMVVMLLGFTICIKKVARPHQSRQSGSFSNLTNYLSVMLLTLTNPLYIFTFLLLFAAAGIKPDEAHMMSNLCLILGVFVGTSSWWFLLTWTINKLRKKFNFRSLWWINKIAGGIIIALGALTIISTIFNLANPSIL